MPPSTPQPIDPTFDIAKKRAMAQFAMEGEERRRRREAEEKFRKEKELLEARKAQEKTRSQGEAARLETEQLAKVKRLREERIAQGAEEKQVTAEVRQSPEVSMSPLRTLKYDMSRMIKDTKQSMVSMAIKEDEKNRMMATGIIQEKKKSYLLLITSLTLLIAGASVLGWWGYDAYQENKIKTTPNAAPQVDSIIYAEGYEDIVVTDENAVTLTAKLKADIVNNNIKIGNVRYDRFVDTASGMIRVLSASEWLTRLNSAAPEALTRLMGETFMYGVFSGAKNSGFIIFKTSYYEKASALMFTWEGSLARDLYPILSGNALTRELQGTRFTDVSIKNINARILKNPDGTTALVYAFLPDKVTLVIAHNEATVLEVLTRITTPKPQTVK